MGEGHGLWYGDEVIYASGESYFDIHSLWMYVIIIFVICCMIFIIVLYILLLYGVFFLMWRNIVVYLRSVCVSQDMIPFFRITSSELLHTGRIRLFN